jgi:prepilin-type N-terminal cleavage/methylation domain-containing protein
MMTSAVSEPTSQRGFSLVEVLMALAIVSGSALALAGAMSQGVQLLQASQSRMIATEKAKEAVESVFTARDTRVLTWAQIRNELGGSGADGGVFKDGPQPLRTVGPDGLVNTADDGAIEALVLPGPDGLLGTGHDGDDVHLPLTDYTREISIRDLGPNLRTITVTVTYPVGRGMRSYVLVTYISSYA